MPVQITILGLNRVGTSIGLALAKIKDQAVRIGNDRNPNVARAAEKLGAVDKTMINLPSAVRDADVVILALPVDEIRATIEVIIQDLKPGCVLIDTSPVKNRVLEWVNELFTDNDRYFVSLTPTLNQAYLMETNSGPDGAHADLFKNGLMFVTSQPGIDESAVTLATNLIQIMGATPIFADSNETDGLIAYSHLLPELVAAALVNATMEQPGWREARKIAGHAYAQTTESVLHYEESKEFGQAAMYNADNIVRMLDLVMAELSQMRDAVAGGNEAALKQRLELALDGRALWLEQRRTADWEPRAQHHVPTSGEFIGRLFGMRPKKDKDSR